MAYYFKNYEGDEIAELLDKAKRGYKADETSIKQDDNVFSLNTDWLKTFIKNIVGDTSTGGEPETPTSSDKILIGNILLETEPVDETDISSLFTSSVIESNLASLNLYEKELDDVLSTGLGNSVKSIEGIPGHYNYFVIMIPTTYTQYEGGETDTDHTYIARISTSTSKYSTLIKGTTITYNNTEYKVYAEYYSYAIATNELTVATPDLMETLDW